MHVHMSKHLRTIIAFSILPLSFLLIAQETKFNNLVFEGAGIRGIAYAGVVEELEKAGILSGVNKVGGTSAGAITALMVSLGYSSMEISAIISGTKFNKFNAGEFLFIGGFSRMNTRYGWYKGDAFNDWLEVIIAEKTTDPDITFSELHRRGFKDLYVTATCLNRQELLVFSPQTYPQMKVKDAVRISMSIPLYFEAVFIDSLGMVYEQNDPDLNLDVVVDGGILANYPIFLFDSLNTDESPKTRIPNSRTIGVRIDSDSQIRSDSLSQKLVSAPIQSMPDYLQAFYVLVLETLNRTSLIAEDWARTISVSSVGISPRIKKLSSEQKEALILSGKRSAKNYLNKD